MIITATSLIGTEARAGQKVGALGHIRPGGGIIHILAAKGDTLAAIYVKVGDVMEKQAPLVLMGSKARHDQAVLVAQNDLDAADRMGALAISRQKLKLEETRKKGQAAVTTQKVNLLKARADHAFTKKRLDRLDKIGGETFSEQQAQLRRYELELARLNLDLAQRTLEQRELDLTLGVAAVQMELKRLVQKREVDLSRTRLALETAKANASSATLRAPSGGTILEIFQHAGDKTDGGPILSMANLNNMAVIAEVFEGDILKLSPGMKATITSKSLPAKLTGRIISIGRMVSENSKVADVKILLDNAETAAKLINLEVDVSIEI